MSSDHKWLLINALNISFPQCKVFSGIAEFTIFTAKILTLSLQTQRFTSQIKLQELLSSMNHWGLFSLSMASFSLRAFHWNLPLRSPKGSLISSPSLTIWYWIPLKTWIQMMIKSCHLCMCSVHISSKWLIKLGIVSVAGKKKGEDPSRGHRSRLSEKDNLYSIWFPHKEARRKSQKEN